MTREERELSIMYLKEVKEEYIEGEGYERHPLPEYYAIENAIEALEQKPCEDCISRQAVLEFIRKQIDHSLWAYTKLVNAIEDLPPVIPQHAEAEIQKMQEMEQAEIQKAYELGKEDKIDVLDKIRAEIDGAKMPKNRMCFFRDGIEYALEIIDKYRAESGEKYNEL